METLSKNEIDHDIGNILKDFRVKHGLTQEKLSEELGISLKYISRVENGSSGVKTQTLIKYMNILGISPNLIYGSFITNESIKDQVDLFSKINSLSDEKLKFVTTIIDLLGDVK